MTTEISRRKRLASAELKEALRHYKGPVTTITAEMVRAGIKASLKKLTQRERLDHGRTSAAAIKRRKLKG